MVHASESYEDAVEAGMVPYDEEVLGANLSRCIVGYGEDDEGKSKHTTQQYIRVFKALKKDSEVFDGFKDLLRVFAKCKHCLLSVRCLLLYKVLCTFVQMSTEIYCLVSANFGRCARGLTWMWLHA